MTHSTRTRGVLALFVLPLVLLSACGKDDVTTPTIDDDKLVLVEEFGTPEIDFDPDDGTTTVVVQFVARDGARDPLRDDNLDIELRIDDRPIDVEGLLSVDSAALASSLHLTLVLDASYSMLRQSPPAFAPMLTSAVRSTQSGKSLYVERPGTFTWDLFWFNNLIYRPDTSLPGSAWLETDIQRIPAPEQGTYTKLYAAVKAAVESSAAHRASTNATARDQHLVVVFSDGADNYSFHDNANEAGTGSIDSERNYTWSGAAPVTLNDVKALLDANPDVQVHAMGLGSQVSDQALATLASSGRGRYFKNVDAAEVDVLFNEVTKEFTSLQTRGATVPLPPGDYDFSVVVRRTDTGAVSNYNFRFRGGVVDARVLR